MCQALDDAGKHAEGKDVDAVSLLEKALATKVEPPAADAAPTGRNDHVCFA